MKQIAVIALGTNTFNLLIAEKSQTGHSVIYKNKIPVRLGEGGIQDKILTQEAMNRGLKALKEHKSDIVHHGISQVYAFATSAIRSASNGEEFVASALNQTGIKINVISGEEEAMYIFHGVSKAVDIASTHSLIIDIGGGSTEFIISHNGSPIWKASFDLGVARLLALFNPSDPIEAPEILQIREHIFTHLSPLFSALKQKRVYELIGSSGSFDSLTDIMLHQAVGKGLGKKKKEYCYDLKALQTIMNQLVQSNRKYRSRLKGLVDYRVDTIVLACIQIQLVLEEMGCTTVRHSTYALREGVIGNVFE